jgi:hypothetical protein
MTDGVDFSAQAAQMVKVKMRDITQLALRCRCIQHPTGEAHRRPVGQEETDERGTTLLVLFHDGARFTRAGVKGIVNAYLTLTLIASSV